MNLKDLTVPFPENEVEWRIGQTGIKGNKQIWAMCLAYVTARAIMDRLDEVVGPENWKAEYSFVSDKGVICRLSIKCGTEWVTKEDGAEQTDVESFKGGISGALKRAAVLWGIGRYLYGLESGFAQICDIENKDAYFAKMKDGTPFRWLPPALPKWALPEDAVSNALPQVHPHSPMNAGSGNGIQTFSYVFPQGPLAKMTPERATVPQLTKYRNWVEERLPGARTDWAKIALQKIEQELMTRELQEESVE